jgi:outer membrane biosynthesis protein TonB
MLIHTAQWSSPQRVLAGAVAKGIKSLFGPEKNAAQPEKTVSNRITRGVTKPLPWPTGGPPENPTKAPGQRPKFVPPRPEPAIKTKTVEKTEPKPRPKPAPGRIDAIIRKTAQRHNLDADLVRAVVKAESNFNPDAVSHAGAMGLMQLMPGTASDLGVDDPFNPSQNVSGGVRYLKAMLNRYNGDLKAALAAYNWGPGNYDRHGPSSMPSETRNYIRTVTSHYQRFASAKA